MSFTAERIPYSQTGSFTKMVSDYLGDAAALRPLYNYRPDIEGIKKAVSDRKNFPVNRNLLSGILQKQYAGINVSAKLKANIDALLSENTFTVCTAHQPNIFTGHLYFIYKILHAVRLSDELNEKIPGSRFVPVYYMGSEDADLEELGEVNIHGNRYHWQTAQTGAVGRMKVDKGFLQIMNEIEGLLAVDKNGPAVLQAMRDAYLPERSVEEATFQFVHRLFNEFGLVILLPDSHELKKEFIPVIKKELEEQFSHEAVNRTVADFPAGYGVQAAGREINLFYLDNNMRERIEKKGSGFAVAGTDLFFTKKELYAAMETTPEKFSPNVILRPVFQEMILPDVAFIGGGGELAYWLELKNVFEAAGAFLPVLLLRNSFSVITKKVADALVKLSLDTADIFRSEQFLLEQLVKKESTIQLNLSAEKEELRAAYEKINKASSTVDSTLAGHSEALFTQAFRRIEVLEKKMLKAEKKKFEAQQRQIAKIKNALFPGGILQERSDNILAYLSVYGYDFLQTLYENSQPVPETFTVLTEQ